jgi:flavin reductase (DIM6/NTAB) family NADH-FMN oxidoreductase RutF
VPHPTAPDEVNPWFGKGVHVLMPATPGSRQVRTVFSRYPAAVAALCAVVEGNPVGLVATSMAMGVSYDPPMITFSCRRESATWPVLRAAPRIGVSVLGQGQAEACTQIAGPAAMRFRGLGKYETERGALFLKFAMTWLECRIAAEVEAGDHVLVVLEVLAVGHDRATTPLIFHDGAFSALRNARPG